jgi:hypothetical protein
MFRLLLGRSAALNFVGELQENFLLARLGQNVLTRLFFVDQQL